MSRDGWLPPGVEHYMIDEDIPSDEECPKCHGVVMLEERERMNGTIVEVAVDCDVCDARYPEVDYGDDA
jgi:hypothetical protein